MSNARQQLHVILGAGQIGPKLAQELLQRGHQVRMVRRSPSGATQPGLTWMRGDMTDAAFAKEALQGADVVYNCTNPPDYHKWDGILQPLFRGIIEATARSGARLVTLDNLYMYGKPDTSPFNEQTPMRPCSTKGTLRAQMVEELFAAHKRGDVRVTSGRASDFFGPETPLSMISSPRFFERLAKGKSLEVFGNPDLPRSYSYSPDVARGLAILGEHPEADGRAWHLPVIHGMTSRKLVEAFAKAANKPAKLQVLPPFLFQVIGLFSPMLRAVREMMYQWEIPYALDDSDFRKTFGVEATPLEVAVTETLRTEAPTLLKK
ncbi:MAG: NAD-dependent epimerase/dehydratase family protein [Myxococcales bacterium]|nr:NAD-dependent epimerase/dehydratase family protein [Myxococcales bacterium]